MCVCCRLFVVRRLEGLQCPRCSSDSVLMSVSGRYGVLPPCLHVRRGVAPVSAIMGDGRCGGLCARAERDLPTDLSTPVGWMCCLAVLCVSWGCVRVVTVSVPSGCRQSYWLALYLLSCRCSFVVFFLASVLYCHLYDFTLYSVCCLVLVVFM